MEGPLGLTFTSILFSGPRMAPRASQVPPGTRTTAPWSEPSTFNPLPAQYPAPHTEGREWGSGSVLVYFLSVVTVTRTPRVGPEALNRTSYHCPLLRAQPLGLPLALHRLACGWRCTPSCTDGVPHSPEVKLDAGVQLGYMITSPTGLQLAS